MEQAFFNTVKGLFKGKRTVSEETLSPSKTQKVPTKTTSKKDDTELIAVITAAIAAMMSESSGQVVPADGLIIRKIKRRR